MYDQLNMEHPQASKIRKQLSEKINSNPLKNNEGKNSHKNLPYVSDEILDDPNLREQEVHNLAFTHWVPATGEDEDYSDDE